MFSKVRDTVGRALKLLLGDRAERICLFVVLPAMLALGVYNCSVRYSAINARPCLLDGYMYITQPGFCSLVLLPLFCFLALRVLKRELRPYMVVRHTGRVQFNRSTATAVGAAALFYTLLIFAVVTVLALPYFGVMNNWEQRGSVYSQLLGGPAQNTSFGGVLLLTFGSLFLAHLLLGLLCYFVLLLSNSSLFSFGTAAGLSVVTLYSRTRLPFLPLWLLSYRDMSMPSLIGLHGLLSLTMAVLLYLLSESVAARKDHIRAQ